jgi:O-antigen/teichoic acid export membrane protein
LFNNIISVALNSKSIKVAALGSLLIKFSSAFFALVNSILLARLLTLQGYGYYILAFSTVTLLAVPLSLGLPNLIVRNISKYEVEGDLAKMKGLLIRANQTVVIIFLIILIIASISYLLWWKNLNPTLSFSLWYGFILLLFIGLGSIRAAFLRGLRFVILGQLPDTTLRNLFFSTILIYLFITSKSLTPPEAILYHAFSAIIAYVIGHIILIKKFLRKNSRVLPKYNTIEWWRESIPFSLNSGIQVVKSKSMAYILAIFINVEASAIFDVAQRGAGLLVFAFDAINAAIGPYLSRAYEGKDFLRLQRILKSTSRLIFIMGIPFFFLFLIGGEKIIIILFGQEYKSSFYPLIILCVGQLINLIIGSVGLLLSMTDNQNYLMKNNLYFLLILLASSIPLIVYLDVIGAAITYSALLIIQNFILFSFIRKNLKLNTSIL